MDPLATRLRELRELRGLSHERLAKKDGVPGRQSLINIERHGQIPMADKVAALARALQVSSDYLLGLTDDPQPIISREDVAAAHLEGLRGPGGSPPLPAGTERRRSSRRAGDRPPP